MSTFAFSGYASTQSRNVRRRPACLLKLASLRATRAIDRNICTAAAGPATPRLISAAFRSGRIKPPKRLLARDAIRARKGGNGRARDRFMHGILSRCLALLAVVGTCVMASPGAAQSEKRVALVIGNSAYPKGALPTTANDAGLIAQTLQAAGFDVVGARDLDGDTMRHALHDFMQKVSDSGPDTVAMVYLAGYGLQLSGENYFLPVDANIAHDSDVPVEGVRLGDYIHQLATLPLRAGIIVIDAARQNPFTLAGQPLAGGLALVEPEPSMLVAYNATPGTVGPNEPGPYGAYAQALAEMIREGGLPLPEVFNRVRLRVNELTQGGLVPWNTQRLQADFVFFERAPDAPQAAPPAEVAAAQTRAIRDFDAHDAYAAALERDTLQSYEQFLAAFPSDPMAPRARALIAARREAITWRRTYRADTPDAYWSYLQRYPEGPHAWDARRRLAALAAAPEPPPAFAAIDYDVPPPPPDETVYVERPVLVFNDPVYAFAPPPPPPVYFLPPPEPEFVVLPPPPPPLAVFVLPTPVFVAFPTYVRPPAYVAPPPNNIIFANIHNTTVINTVINKPVVAAPAAAPAANAPPAGGARPGGAAPVLATATPALPPSVQKRATIIQQQGLKGPPGQGQRPTLPGQAPQANLPQHNTLQPLPGAGGQPLPKSNMPPPAPAQTNRAPALANTQPNAPAHPGPPPSTPTGSLPPKPNVASPTLPGPQGPIPHAPPPPPQIANRPPPHITPQKPPPPVVNRPSPPVVNRPPPPPPPVANRAPPPAVINRPPPPPPVVNRPPPPPVVNRPPPPPPPVANRAPPPAVVNRPPPPPPVVNRPPPPPPVVSRPPPPPVANRAPPPAPNARRCVDEHGKRVC